MQLVNGFAGAKPTLKVISPTDARNHCDWLTAINVTPPSTVHPPVTHGCVIFPFNVLVLASRMKFTFDKKVDLQSISFGWNGSS